MTYKLATSAFVILLTVALAAPEVRAWGCSRSFSGFGAYGGSFSHTSATVGGWGGFAHAGASSYTSPSGRTFTASHTSSGSYGYGGYHGYYSGYHGYGYGGCYGGGFGAGLATGAVAGAVVGGVVGAAVASNNNPVVAPTYVYPPPVTYAYPTSGVYVAPPPAPVVVPATPVIGSRVTVLPLGCAETTVKGAEYYQFGTVWYRPMFGSNGVYYQVVAAP